MNELVDLIESTVKLEQPAPGGLRTIGTGFLVADAAPDGTPRTILVTAHHVLDRMPAAQATVGLRVAGEDGQWRYAPILLTIRTPGGERVWTRHPVQDIAAIQLPQDVAGKAIPIHYLAGHDALDELSITAGDELIVLGYPLGVAANKEGFPILRSGRVASYPIAPAARYPTFLLDFSVFAGNSGGPVFVNTLAPAGGSPALVGPRPVIVGLLTQQIKMDGDRLAIGNVIQARFIAETISLLTTPPSQVEPVEAPPVTGERTPASDPRPLSWHERVRDAVGRALQSIQRGLLTTWIIVRDTVLGWATAPQDLWNPTTSDR